MKTDTAIYENTVSMRSDCSLVEYVSLSPNHSGHRTHGIDRITPHCAEGQFTVSGIGDWFSRESVKASSNYGIDRDGRVGMYVAEENRSWCSASSENDQRAVTIECASDTQAPHKINDATYLSLIRLCTDICRRSGKRKLLWLEDREKTLKYDPAPDEMVITREYPREWEPGEEPYYPVNDEKNDALYRRYAALAKQEENVCFGGRLGEYRYYDMDQTVTAAMRLAEKLQTGG